MAAEFLLTVPATSEQDNFTHRTGAWLVNLAAEATAVPGHAPPLAVCLLLLLPPLELLPILTPTFAFQNLDTNNLASARNRPSNPPMDPARPHRERHQAPDDSAIRGNFIPLSTSFTERSPSPRREQGAHGVFLQLSLTDSQMDRLTAA